MSDPKELQFFSWDRIYAKGFEWYESHFEDAGDKRMRGEGSQSYSVRLLFPNAAQRIAAYAPDLKFIYIVRHPLERIESMWLGIRSWDYGRLEGFFRQSGVGPDFVGANFCEVIRNNPQYVGSANYLQEINAFRKYYPDDRFLVLFFDDFTADYRAVLNQCWEFLGVDTGVAAEVPPTHLNKSAEKRFQGRAYELLMKTPGFNVAYRIANRLLPRGLMDHIDEKMLSSENFGRPEWNPQVRNSVIEDLREDTAAFLEFAGRPRDYWIFE